MVRPWTGILSLSLTSSKICMVMETFSGSLIMVSAPTETSPKISIVMFRFSLGKIIRDSKGGAGVLGPTGWKREIVALGGFYFIRVSKLILDIVSFQDTYHGPQLLSRRIFTTLTGIKTCSRLRHISENEMIVIRHQRVSSPILFLLPFNNFLNDRHLILPSGH